MEHYDDVIVGAGLVGLSTALSLARLGRSVAVLESREIAAGASGGPGMRGVRSNARHPAELRLAATALRIWSEASDALGRDTGFERRGSIQLVDRSAVAADGGMRRLEVVRDVQSRRGVESRVLSRPELEERLGAVGDEVECGILVEQDGVAPHEFATRAFATAAVDAGVTIAEHCSVLQINPRTDGGAILTTSTGEIRARRTVAVCANSGTRPLVQASLGIDLPLWDVAFHAYFIEPDRPAELAHLIGHDSRRLAAKSVPGGWMQVSGFLTGPWDAAAESSLAGDELFAESEATFRSVLPSFPSGRVVAREARVESCSPDGLQLIDRLADSDVFIAAGWSGHGFATAPAVGPALAEWMSGGIRPDLLAPFAWPRW